MTAEAIALISGIVAIESTLLGLAFYFGRKMDAIDVHTEELKNHQRILDDHSSRLTDDEKILSRHEEAIGALLPKRAERYKK